MSDVEEIDITTDEVAVKDRRKQAVIAAKQSDLDFYDLLKTELGRRVIWELIGIHGPFVSSYSKDPVEMAFNEGQRNFAVRVIDRMLRVCPELYVQAQSEAISRNKSMKGAA